MNEKTLKMFAGVFGGLLVLVVISCVIMCLSLSGRYKGLERTVRYLDSQCDDLEAKVERNERDVYDVDSNGLVCKISELQNEVSDLEDEVDRLKRKVSWLELK